MTSDQFSQLMETMRFANAACSTLDGGLWPLFWVTVALCVTVCFLKTRKSS